MRRKTLVLYIVIVALLAGGVALFAFWPEPDDGEEDPSPSTGPVTGEMINVAQDEVAMVSFYPSEGKQYSITRDPESGQFSFDSADAIFPLKQTDSSSVFSYAIRLTSLTLVTEEATDGQLSMFGLTSPAMRWVVSMTDGSSIELAIGAQQPAGTGRYARRTDSRDVFLLASYQSGYLTREADSLYDLSFFPYAPSTEDNPTWMAIEYCLLEGKSGVIEIRKRTEEEFVNLPLGTSEYQILQPVESESNSYSIQTALFEPITKLSPKQIVEAFPEDLAKYGLVDPYRLELVCEDEWSGTLLIGNFDAELGGYYVMIEGYDAVLLDSGGDYRFLGVEFSYLRSSMVWLYNIITVSSVEFMLEGETRTLRYEHNDEDETLRGWLDGFEISQDNARRLYTATLSIMQDGASEAEIPPGAPNYRLTINFRDGGSDTIELYRISETSYLIVHDGVNTNLAINRMSIQQNLLSKFEALDRGEDLPR